jgi:class 3 adenylate cyclase
MGTNEEATVSTLNSYRNIIDSLIARHHGRFVGSAGDSVLAEFASVVEAVQCAVEIQAFERTRTPVCRQNAGWSFASASTSAT